MIEQARFQEASAFRAVMLLSVMILVGATGLRAEVVLISRSGRPVVGASIKSEDKQFVELEIYRGLSRKIPKGAVVRRVSTDRSQAAERSELTRRLKELKADDVRGHLELAKWAREKKLVVQSLALLLDLKKRFPKDAGVLAALAEPPEKKALSKGEEAFLTKQITAFLAGPEDRRKAVEALRGKDTIPAGTIDAWARRCFAEARKGPKVKAGDSKFKRGRFESGLHIELWRRKARKEPEPKDAGAEKTATEAPWPVVISLHGGGAGSGHWKLGGPMWFGLFRRHLDKAIFVAPTVMKKRYAEWGGNPDEEQQVKEILKAVKRSWDVDTNRVYLAGYSMGGYGTWHIGGHQADLFAGLVSGAGGILIGSGRGEAWGWGIVGNLMHTPIAFAHGGRDQPAPPWSDAECDGILKALGTQHPGSYRYKYLVYPKAGHGLPRDASAKAVRWVTKFTREPYPSKISWEPKRSFNTQFYWLTVEEPQIFTRLDAEIKENAVSINALNLNGGFSVLLNRHLVDMSKPVTVTVNGRRVFEGQVRPSLSTILATISDRIDEQQWFSARVEF